MSNLPAKSGLSAPPGGVFLNGSISFVTIGHRNFAVGLTLFGEFAKFNTGDVILFYLEWNRLMRNRK